ncbi:MAG: NAD(P)-binding domain-containing protein [Blastocatellia bacterium]|nr:NAD(P)-binding domain-containing protein [Blastocatellia bacterium]
MTKVAIFGTGHLAKTLLKGLNLIRNEPILLYGRSSFKANQLKQVYQNLILVKDAIELAKAEVIFLLIPANAILTLEPSFLQEVKHSVLIFCANSLTVEDLQQRLGVEKIVKLLPNIHWQYLKGVMLLRSSVAVSEKEIAFLSNLGKVHKVASEQDFDHMTLFTSCLPGLIAEMLKTMSENVGILNQQQKELFLLTVLTTVESIYNSNQDFDQIIEEVANKGGLTEVGIKVLNKYLPLVFQEMVQKMNIKILDRKESLAKG